MPPLTAITFDWRPGDATYQHLSLLNIPRKFIEDQVSEFILYWQERGQQNHGWNAKFAKHVMHEWRKHEIDQAKQQAVKPLTAMTGDWRPNNKATEFLLQAGITRAFIDECIVSFVMYWTERGELHNTWNTKFVGHCQYRDQQAQAIANVQNKGVRHQSIHDELSDRSWGYELREDLRLAKQSGGENA